MGALNLKIRAGVGEGVGGGGDVIERERLGGVDGDVGGVDAAEPSILLSPVTSMRSLPPLPVMVPPMIVVVARLSVPSTVSNPPVLVKTSLVMVVAPAANTSMVPRLVMAPLVIPSTALSVSVWVPST